jgi:hypothetical protein
LTFRDDVGDMEKVVADDGVTDPAEHSPLDEHVVEQIDSLKPCGLVALGDMVSFVFLFLSTVKGNKETESTQKISSCLPDINL